MIKTITCVLLFVVHAKAEIFYLEENILQPSKLNWSKIETRSLFAHVHTNRKIDIFENRIIGGDEAKPHSHPYQTALLVEAQKTFFCGGSLISTNFILTTAHCVMDAKTITVVLGAHDLKEFEPTQILTEGKLYIKHDAWDENTFINNIAVIKLRAPVTLTPAIQLVKLPKLSDINVKDIEEIATMIGWGKTSDKATEMTYKLRQTLVPIITNQVCAEIFDHITPMHICTSGKEKKGACDADSGGPLILDDRQVGIISYTNKYCEQRLPTVLTRVSHYLKWIAANSDAVIEP